MTLHLLSLVHSVALLVSPNPVTAGGLPGARFVAGLDEGAGGKPLVRIYADCPAAAYAANEVVDQAIGQNSQAKLASRAWTHEPCIRQCPRSKLLHR